MASKSYLHAAGTKNYAPYEAYTQNRMMVESNVWSIGVIIIEVITGVHPFEGKTQEETINNIKTGKYKPLPNYIQNEMKLILEEMINLDYTKRPTVKSLLEIETMQLVAMIEKSKEQKGSEQENEQMNKENNELKAKVRSLEVEKEKEKDRADLSEQENQKALSEIDKLKQKVNLTEQEKQKAQSERDQEKRRADTEHAENDKLKQEKQKELQEKQKSQFEVTRLTTEVQQLKSEISKLRPLTTSPKEQQKPEPKLQQIQKSVPSSLSTITYQSIIPDSDHVIQQENKIIRTNKGKYSTVAFDPVITSGIVRFGGFFERHSISLFIIGIADASAVFGSDECPWDGYNEKKTVCYWYNGRISHIGGEISGNSSIELNKSVSCEVNMNISPRTLTFFYDNQEQGLSVRNIPSSIRFWVFLQHENSSFTINRFENVQYSSAKGVSNGKVFEWGKEWKRD
ncbi:MAG: hypothetical protein EZS28_027644 [Streblomastix strix]|uniref:Protein kinase domain-containing protein n=1 Tax=Streblomastix strix TaxID=222440 RepID=A0A5J4V261_9EUKA|nr:MAG: hypothetical protein EZS28_027644 [Streblomastix strix]